MGGIRGAAQEAAALGSDEAERARRCSLVGTRALRTIRFRLELFRTVLRSLTAMRLSTVLLLLLASSAFFVAAQWGAQSAAYTRTIDSRLPGRRLLQVRYGDGAR